MTMAYHREHKVATRIVRIFNTYGPRMRLNDGRVVPAFVSQALKNKPVTVFGKGLQTRCFCYVSDLIEGIYRLMMSDYDLPVNIGNPVEMTMLEFAEEIIRVTGAKSKIVFKPLPQDDPKQRRPDITKAKKILKWEPVVPLAEGMAKTIEYFRTKAFYSWREPPDLLQLLRLRFGVLFCRELFEKTFSLLVSEFFPTPLGSITGFGGFPASNRASFCAEVRN